MKQTIEIPEGYELVESINDSGDKIYKIVKKNCYPRWEDLLDIKRYFLNSQSYIQKTSPDGKYETKYENKNIFKTREQAEASLAASQISQLMPYYGGIVSHRENAFILVKDSLNNIEVYKFPFKYMGGLLRFKTKELANSFLNKNKELVELYLDVFQ